MEFFNYNEYETFFPTFTSTLEELASSEAPGVPSHSIFGDQIYLSKMEDLLSFELPPIEELPEEIPESVLQYITHTPATGSNIPEPPRTPELLRELLEPPVLITPTPEDEKPSIMRSEPAPRRKRVREETGLGDQQPIRLPPLLNLGDDSPALGIPEPEISTAHRVATTEELKMHSMLSGGTNWADTAVPLDANQGNFSSTTSTTNVLMFQNVF